MKIDIGGSKLQDEIHYLQRWISGDSPGPLIAEVSPTYGCNHNCVHCGFQQYTRYNRKYALFLNSAIFKQFLEDFRSLGGIEIYFAGNGEPLVNPLLPEWLQYGYGLGLNMTLSTNGVLLTDKKARAILPFLKWIRFTVNGGDKATYSKVHCCSENDFDRLVHNLDDMVKYRDSHKLKVKLIIQFLAYDLNWESIPAILGIHRNIGTDLLRFRSVISGNKKLTCSKDVIKALRDIEGKEKVHIRWDTYGRKNNEAKWEKCYGINFHTNMDHEGNLFTCYRHLFKNSIYGNIYNERFIDIWNSPRRKKIFSEVAHELKRPNCKKWCQTTYDNIFICEYLRDGRYAK